MMFKTVTNYSDAMCIKIYLLSIIINYNITKHDLDYV